MHLFVQKFTTADQRPESGSETKASGNKPHEVRPMERFETRVSYAAQ